MPKEISLYFHWPFCEKKCPYCDFNSYVSSTINHELWEKAYLQALQYYLPHLKNKVIKSVYFGGGTPSLMLPSLVNSLLTTLKKYNNNLPITEITLETNPSTFEKQKFIDFQQAGINRLSLGVQSFNEDNLKFLGRNHTAQESLLALEQSNIIFPRTTFDLIMGLPQQTLANWQEELQIALPLIKEHISIYQLTIEEGTPFFIQRVPEALEDIALSMYNYNVEKLAKQGIYRYEISNFAKKNAESIHNLNYWLGGEYIGIGPGAHGRLRINNEWYATFETKNPQQWLKKVINNENNSHIEKIPLSTKERLEEKIMTLLRTNYSLPTEAKNIINPSKLQEFLEHGLLNIKNQKIYSTDQGKLCLNYLLGQLLV